LAKIAIAMGSKSDRPVVKRAEDILKEHGAECEVRVLSAHRTPKEAAAFAESLEEGGYDAAICAAGKAAHLAGIFAALSTVPIIGLPVKTDVMGGLDSLLSTVQMPKGVPVATVAIDGAENAAWLALEIAAVRDPGLRARLKKEREKMREMSLADDEEARH
jgi:5-(carboxyamino)imidazole ribonucleotide mutase